MVLRALAVALLASGWLLPSLAHGLAIGDIKTRSALNQPFLGEVLLTDVNDLSPDEIHVDLATQEQFQQMGVEKTQLLNQLRFQVVKRPDGTAMIRVRTEQPVTEPDLDFVLRVSWPGNTSMREFVALLDLPNTGSEANASSQESVAPPVVQASPVQQNTPTPVVAPVSTAVQDQSMASAPVARPPAQMHSTSIHDHYRPRSGETLWEVASKTKPAAALTIPQTMIAIQKANPQSFPNGNINEMTTKRSLSIPSATDIRRIGAREAAQAVARQDQVWHQHHGAEALAAAQVNATGVQETTEAPVASHSAEVHLLAPGKASARGMATASSAKQNENNKIAGELMKENALLKAQLDSDQQQIKQQQQLLVLEDQKLAELEAAIKQVKQMAANPAAPIAAHAVSATAPATTTSIPAPAPVPVPAPAPAVAAVVVKSVAQTPVSTVEPKLAATPTHSFSLLMFAGIGLAGLAALVGGLIAYRRYRDAQDVLHDPVHDHHLPVFDEPTAFLPENEDLAHLSTMFESEPEPEPDLWTEAEAYLDRGRFPQAAGLLHKILRAEPDRVDARLRLMQCQAEMADFESFAEHEAILQQTNDPVVMAKVNQLREKYPQLRRPVAKPVEPVEEDSFEAMEFAFSQSLTKTQIPAVGADLAEDDSAFKFTSRTDLGGDVELPMDLDFAEPTLETVVRSAPVVEELERPVYPKSNEMSMDFTPLVQENVQDEALVSDPAVAEESADLDDLNLDEFSLDFGNLLAPESVDLTDAPQDVRTEAESKDLDFSIDQLEEELSRSGLSTSELVPESLESEPSADQSDEFAQLEQASLDMSSLEDEDKDWSKLQLSAVAELEPLPELEPVADLDAMDFPPLDEIKEIEESPEPVADFLPENFDLSMPLDEVSLEEPPAETESVQAESAVPAFDESGDLDLGDDFNFLADVDENATKLDLAKAYMDMGDKEGARDILQEVLTEGSHEQQEEAQELLHQVG